MLPLNTVAAAILAWVSYTHTHTKQPPQTRTPMAQKTTFPTTHFACETRTHGGILLAVSIAIIAFLSAFYIQPIQSTEFTRSDLWLQLADVLLGLEEPATAHSAESGFKFIPQRFPHVLQAITLFAAAWLYGSTAVRFCLNRNNLTHVENFVLAMGAGLAILSLITLATGLAGWLSTPALFAPLSVSLATRLLRLKQPQTTPQPQSNSHPHSWIRFSVVFVLVPYTVYLLWGAITPQTDFDVREYHLQGPKEWFQQGRISCLRHNVYTSFPFLSEMLCLAGMIVAGDWRTGALTGQLLLASFQPLSAAAVFAVARRWLGTAPAWIALLIHLTTPWTLRVSLIAYTEGALTFYLIASVLLNLKLQNATTSSLKPLPLLFSGFLAGSAMACKYTGLVLVILPLAASWLFHLGQLRKADCLPNSKAILRAGAVFIAGILLATGPWLARNWYDTGNPVYPLGYSLFNSADWNDPLDIRWKAAHSPTEHSLARIPQHILDAALYNTWTSPLLFGLALPAAPLLWRRLPQIRPILAFAAWGFFSWWAFTHRIDRFWIPVIPLLAVASASLWLLGCHSAWRNFLLAVCALATLWNLRFCTTPQVGFHAGLMDLNAATQLVIRSDIALLNQQLPRTAKVLMVGEAEVFDAQFPLLYNTVFDDSTFESLAALPDKSPPGSRKPLRPTAEFLALCRQQQITHILVNWSEILRYRLPGSYGYSEFVQPARFNELVTAHVLQTPTVLIRRNFNSLTPTEQQEILRWDAGNTLVDSGEFHAVLLYSISNNQ